MANVPNKNQIYKVKSELSMNQTNESSNLISFVIQISVEEKYSFSLLKSLQWFSVWGSIVSRNL